MLHRAAQYNPPADYAALDVFDKQTKDEAEKNSKSPLAVAGFVHVPAIWRDSSKKERHLGGILVRGEIRRDVTVNLVALRALGGENGKALRRYILGLALVAAAEPQDGFLRQGCLITPDPDTPAVWSLVARDGRRAAAPLDGSMLLAYAQTRAKAFGVGENRSVAFDKKLAKVAVDNAVGKKAGKKNAKTAPPGEDEE